MIVTKVNLREDQLVALGNVLKVRGWTSRARVIRLAVDKFLGLSSESREGPLTRRATGDLDTAGGLPTDQKRIES